MNDENQTQHPDDAAVDRFAAQMKEKLRKSREEKGRGGWDDPGQVSCQFLCDLLIGHLTKANPGNFLDIANFSMMLHERGADPHQLGRAFINEADNLRDEDVAHLFNGEHDQ